MIPDGRKNRHKVEITYSILSAAKEGVGKTQLMRRVNLNSSQMISLFQNLLRNGLLNEVTRDDGGAIYATTDVGRRFLESYDELKSMLDESLLADKVTDELM